MSDREINVIVVGGSWAGIRAIKSLLHINHTTCPNLNITLVEQRTQYFHKSGIVRGMVDDGYAENLFIPYKRLFSDSEILTSNHRLVCGRLSQVHNNFVELEGGRRLFFDYLILATGAQYQSLPVAQASSIEESRMLFSSMRDAIQRANRILFVGGGAVGVGMCGEVAEKFPNKTIMIAHARRHLLNEDLSGNFSTVTEKKLRKLGVQLILGETVLPNISQDYHSQEQYERKGLQVYTTKAGNTIVCDLAIWTIGARPETGYMCTLAPSLWERPLVDPMTGQIQVLPTLQLNDPLYPHIFAIGDVNSMPLSEKYAPNAVAQAKAAVNNIHTLIREGHDYRAKMNRSTGEINRTHPTYLTPYLSIKNQAVLPVGTKQEVSNSWGKRFSSWISGTKKGREYMLDKAMKLLNY